MNVQHDCQAASCSDVVQKVVRQEQLPSNVTWKVAHHNSVNMWLLNTHSIHNYQAITWVVLKGIPPPPRAVADVAAVRAKVVALMAQKKDASRAVQEKKKAEAQTAKEKKKA